MKLTYIKHITALSALLFIFGGSLSYAKSTDTKTSVDFEEVTYDEDDQMFDFDSIFDEAEDTEEQEETKAPSVTEIVQNTCNWNYPIRFFGSFTLEGVASEGINYRLEKEEGNNYLLGALGKGSLGVIFTPSSYFRVVSSVSASVPKSPTISLGSLYCDYNFLDKAYITFGLTGKSWSNSELVYTTESFSSAGTVIVDIPLRHGAQIEGIACLSSNNISLKAATYAGALEFTLLGFAIKPYGVLMPSSRQIRAGTYISGDFFGWQTAFFAKASSKSGSYKTYYNSYVAAEIGRYWEIPQKIGFMLGYTGNHNMTDGYTQTAYLTAGWSHVAGSRYSPGFSGSYNINGKSGVFTTALSIADILPHATLKLAIPVIYGNTSFSVGDNTSYSLAGAGEGKVKVYCCAHLKITASF